MIIDIRRFTVQSLWFEIPLQIYYHTADRNKVNSNHYNAQFRVLPVPVFQDWRTCFAAIFKSEVEL